MRDARSMREGAGVDGAKGSGRTAHTEDPQSGRKHHELSSKVLRQAAAAAGVGEMVAFRVALGIEVEDGDRAAVLTALAARGVRPEDLPCRLQSIAPMAVIEKRLNERTDR